MTTEPLNPLNLFPLTRLTTACYRPRGLIGIIFLSLLLSTSNGSQSTGGGDTTGVGIGLIAFPGRDALGRQQLFTIRIDGTDRRQVTFENDNSMPSWSPDGA